MRIVSLLPSATEIVYALGLDHALVGVTFECDEPVRARQEKTVVVGGRDTRGMTPIEIDRYVRETTSTAGELYTLHEGALRDLDPTLVLTQDLCRVCALPSGTVADALAHLGCTAEVLALDPYSLQDVLETIRTVGAATGRERQAEDLLGRLGRRLRSVTRPATPPRVAVVEWVDPLFLAGHWVPDMVRAAGGTPVGGFDRERSAASAWADLPDVDVVVVSPCGFGLAGAVEQAAVVLAKTTAPQVWAVDGDAVVVRPGPRLVDGVEAFAALFRGIETPGVTQRLR